MKIAVNGDNIHKNTTTIGNSIMHTVQLQQILDKYYTRYMMDKLILYNKIINKLINRCFVNNEQLLNLIRAVETERSYKNKFLFRKNNTLSNLINLYNMIYHMLINYDITENNYCFYMLVNVSISMRTYVHLKKYFNYDGNLIELIINIRQMILSLAHVFLNKIYLLYCANYHPANISLSPNVSERNNEQKYEAQIDLYIQFLSMYNLINLLIQTFFSYSIIKNNSIQIFIAKIEKMFNDISNKNKILFKEYIKYLGRVKIGTHKTTGYGDPDINTLLKGLYFQRQVW